jgi:uncharacterized phiE125 gp8 family phage protein
MNGWGWGSVWDRAQWYGTGGYTQAHSALYRLKLIGPPEDVPITFEEAALHLRLGDPAGAEATMQQSLIESMLAAAVGEVQRYCDIAILTQTWGLSTPWLNSPQILPKAPLQTVVSITDPSGNVVDPAGYRVTTDERLPGMIAPASGHWTWSQVPNSPPVEIEFTAGWEAPDEVPSELVQAMLLMVGTWFMHRESAQPFTLSVIPEHAGVTALLDPFRVEVLA